MLHALLAALRSMVLHAAFCTQGEHKREAVCESFGHLVYRCLDCGRTREIGTVFVGVSNRKAQR